MWAAIGPLTTPPIPYDPAIPLGIDVRQPRADQHPDRNHLGTPGFRKLDHHPVMGFFNSGWAAHRVSGTSVQADLASGTLLGISAAPVPLASGPDIAGVLNFSSTVSGLYSTSTLELGIGLSLRRRWHRQPTRRLHAQRRGGTLFNFGFTNIGTLNLGNANLGDYNVGSGNLGSYSFGSGNIGNRFRFRTSGSNNFGFVGGNNLGFANTGPGLTEALRNIGFGVSAATTTASRTSVATSASAFWALEYWCGLTGDNQVSSGGAELRQRQHRLLQLRQRQHQLLPAQVASVGIGLTQSSCNFGHLGNVERSTGPTPAAWHWSRQRRKLQHRQPGIGDITQATSAGSTSTVQKPRRPQHQLGTLATLTPAP